jgi:hypothetical protein
MRAMKTAPSALPNVNDTILELDIRYIGDE